MSLSGLLTNIHKGAAFSSENQEKLHLVSGTYEYYHYLCDGFDDRVSFFSFCSNFRRGVVPTYVYLASLALAVVAVTDTEQLSLRRLMGLVSFRVGAVGTEPCRRYARG